MMKNFHIGAILTVTTGRLLCTNGMDGVYSILNYMTEDNLYTHQLPRASDECKPHLIAQYPWLADIDASNVTAENWASFICDQAAAHGMELPVSPLPLGAHKKIDPLLELSEMTDKSKIVVVVAATEKN